MQGVHTGKTGFFWGKVGGKEEGHQKPSRFNGS